MADVECTAAVSADELRALGEAIYVAYESGLELCSVLEAFDAMEPAPPGAYALARMANRCSDLVSEAHTALLRLVSAAERPGVREGAGGE